MLKETAQTTSHILMVRPANFGFNEETASSNAFQSNDNLLSSSEISKLAIAEFDSMVAKLRNVGVDVITVEDTNRPLKPDAIFPNNWVTFHQNATIVTYPMYAPVRRLERRDDIIKGIQERFRVEQKIQLQEYEEIDQYLEGTGSMIIDRPNKLVYACLSARTHPDLLVRFCKLMGYTAVPFHAVDGNSMEIYHTNVMMALGESFVVICMETVQSEIEEEMLRNKFAATGKEIIEITLEQMLNFAGNMLQVSNEKGETFLLMSGRAFESLTDMQIAQISKHTNILSSPIPTIETYGGGSVRCMMAEVFLPLK
ncbi:MAG: amidinotransferase [Saprospiraceae bacterium]|nr:amidinotransferase [Saprospiraceae bacterium]